MGALITGDGVTSTDVVTVTPTNIGTAAVAAIVGSGTPADGNKIIGLSANGATDGALFSVSETGTLRSVTIASGAIPSTGLITGAGITTSGAITATSQTIASGAITSSALITGDGVTSTDVVN